MWRYIYNLADGALVSETDQPVAAAELAAAGLGVKVKANRRTAAQDWDPVALDLAATVSPPRIALSAWVARQPEWQALTAAQRTSLRAMLRRGLLHLGDAGDVSWIDDGA